MLNQALIENLDKQRCAAMIAEDVATLEKLFHKSLLWVHSTARVDTRSSFLAGIGSTTPKYLEITRESVEIRCFGSSAIVNGVQKMRCVIKGQERDVVNRYINAWVEIDGQAQLVAWQSTAVPSAA
jgi:hypothetical protein